MKYLILGSILLSLSGCAKPDPLWCPEREFTVNASKNLSAEQRLGFEEAMSRWESALGEGFLTWKIQDKEQEVENCIISISAASEKELGTNIAGLSTRWTNGGEGHRLAGGTADILKDVQDSREARKIWLHEIGHLLGLPDSKDPDSVMFFASNGMHWLDVPDKDALAVKQLWNVSDKERQDLIAKGSSNVEGHEGSD